MPRVRVLAALLTVLAAPPAARAQLPLLHPLLSPSPNADGNFGHAVAAVPDVDGDGRADVLVGAFRETSPIVQRLGRAYAFSGTTGLLLNTLISVTANVTTDGGFGVAVAGMPDADGDGRGEYVVGAYRENMPGADEAGRVYVYAGITEALLYALVSPNPQLNGHFGSTVAVVPDVTGDGLADVLVGAPGESVANVDLAGRVYLFSGATGAPFRTLQAPSNVAGTQFGASVAGVADADGDGRGDLLVGAPGTTAGGEAQAGRAYLYSGNTGALLRTLNTTTPTLSGRFGHAVSSVPDTDGDGRADLLVGAYGEPPGATDPGRAYLFSGATGTLLHALQSPNPQAFGNFGYSVAGAPDLSGDGRGDLLIGARLEQGGVSESGRVHVFSGANGALIRTVTSPNAALVGNFGLAVAALPDADGDGRADLIVGAPEETGGAENAGRSYVFSTSAIVAGESGPEERGLTLTATPNPTGGAATLTFTLDRTGAVRLAVYDALGREVVVLVNDVRTAGRHEAALEASSLAQGVYLARLEGAGEVVTRPVVVTR